jgi:L-lysine 2,3-aminomutase
VALHRALRARTSGIGLPAYVVDLPDGSGKIPVEEWLARGDGDAKE